MHLNNVLQESLTKKKLLKILYEYARLTHKLLLLLQTVNSTSGEKRERCFK